MRPYVNIYVLRALLDPLGSEDSDDDVAKYADFDTNDEAAVRQLIRTLIKPYYERWGPASREIGRRSLAYWLSFRRDQLEITFNSCFLPLGPTGTWSEQTEWTQEFFVKIWEELFGPDDYHLTSADDYEVRNENDEANWILKR
ncbi:MAG: hypothetical protein NVSMB32_02960 [Actinomycetota bacterium]